MPQIRILTEQELRAAIGLDLATVDCVEDAFRRLSNGGVVMPPILSMELPGGELDAKTAFVPGLASMAFKISTGFYGNAARGLPSLSGLMVVLSAETGHVEAVLLDNGYLTDLRTAAAGAVAARALARADASVAAVFGTGLQARLQLEALCLVRPIREARIWGRDAFKAERLASQMSQRLGISAIAEADGARAMSGADVVITTTPAEAPIVMADWLAPGQHLTAMGSDAPGKAELTPACISRADRYVPDRLSQTRLLGELRGAIAAGVVAADAEFPELGDVLCGLAPGRLTPGDITLADLTGTGIQDTAIAARARARAAELNAGTDITS